MSDMTKERNTSHGMTYTKEYLSWCNMHSRCKNPKSVAYKNYGGRGITVCEDWDSFENFIRDMGRLPYKEATLERKDVNKGYDKENCVWASWEDQHANKRNTVMVEINGEKLAARKLARSLGLNPNTVLGRLRREFPIDRAFDYKLPNKEQK